MRWFLYRKVYRWFLYGPWFVNALITGQWDLYGPELGGSDWEDAWELFEEMT
jgi:hypothetical protein